MHLPKVGTPKPPKSLPVSRFANRDSVIQHVAAGHAPPPNKKHEMPTTTPYLAAKTKPGLFARLTGKQVSTTAAAMRRSTTIIIVPPKELAPGGAATGLFGKQRYIQSVKQKLAADKREERAAERQEADFAKNAKHIAASQASAKERYAKLAAQAAAKQAAAEESIARQRQGIRRGKSKQGGGSSERSPSLAAQEVKDFYTTRQDGNHLSLAPTFGSMNSTFPVVGSTYTDMTIHQVQSIHEVPGFQYFTFKNLSIPNKPIQNASGTWIPNPLVPKINVSVPVQEFRHFVPQNAPRYIPGTPESYTSASMYCQDHTDALADKIAGLAVGPDIAFVGDYMFEDLKGTTCGIPLMGLCESNRTDKRGCQQESNFKKRYTGQQAVQFWPTRRSAVRAQDYIRSFFSTDTKLEILATSTSDVDNVRELLQRAHQTYTPKVIFLHVGLNDFIEKKDFQADWIKLENFLFARYPSTKFVIHPMIPCAGKCYEAPNDIKQDQIDAANSFIKARAAASKKHALFLDCTRAIMKFDASKLKKVIDWNLMPDLIHMNVDGHQKWADCYAPVLKDELAKLQTGKLLKVLR